ncbi:hypothetical protein MCOR25_003351 [Pyricularia grisea]|nr:hypothetical protein MCOR25_003351 [Pyricularia grisea]
MSSSSNKDIPNSPQKQYTKMRRERGDWMARYPAYSRVNRNGKEFIMYKGDANSEPVVQLVHSDTNVRSGTIVVYRVNNIPGNPVNPASVIANEYQQFSTLPLDTLKSIQYAVVTEPQTQPIVLNVIAASGVKKGPILFDTTDNGWTQLQVTSLVRLAQQAAGRTATLIQVETGIDPPEASRGTGNQTSLTVWFNVAKKEWMENF